MTDPRPELRVFLDEGVPVSVGKAFEAAGHEVIYLRDAVAPGSPDPLVCAAAEANDAILVAFDNDMRLLAQSRGVGRVRFKRLSLIKFACRESEGVRRLEEAMSLIEHEWMVTTGKPGRRVFIEIGTAYIRTHR